MPSFGSSSMMHLDTCHPDIKEVLHEAIKHFDFSVIWGHRGQSDQDSAYRNGHSKRKWPTSRHNTRPSEAVDIVPYPGDFDNPDETFYEMATYIYRAAALRGIHLRWGGHWPNFKDLAHFELELERDI